MSLTKVKVQLPYGSDPSRGPGWTNLWVREGTDDEAILNEIWIMDTWHLRGLDIRTPRDDNGMKTGPDPLVVDLGANIGLFSALVCQMFPTARVLAVEPDRENFDILTLNVAKWRDRVELERVAIGAEEGEATLIGSHGTGHTIVPNHVDRYDTDQQVQQRSLASLLDRPVALLKVDIEGAEHDAVAGCPSEALANARLIHMEWHGSAEAPWVDDAPRRYGELVAKLAYTHSVQMFGSPDRGGYLFGHSYPADA